MADETSGEVLYIKCDNGKLIEETEDFLKAI